MKKVITVLVFAVSTIACQQKAAVVESPTNDLAITAKDSICIDLVNYYAINDDTTLNDDEKSFKKAEWLRNNGANVCKKHLDDAMANHNVKPSEITGLNAKPFSKSRQDIETVIDGATNYDKYIAFPFDGKDRITGMVRVDSFSITPVCYSIPLFEFLFNRYKMTDTDELKFHVVTVGSKKTVVIEVLDGDTVKPIYYGFSNEPSFTDQHLAPKK